MVVGSSMQRTVRTRPSALLRPLQPWRRLLSTGAAEHHDLAVVGLGAMGSATCFQAADRGLKVLGLDRHAPPHQMGSTHAETRITRLAVGEGPQYLPFVARSHEIWREIERRTGVPLLHLTGGFIITPAQSNAPPEEVSAIEEIRWLDFVSATENVAMQAGVDFQRHTAAEVRARCPNVLVTDDEVAGFEPTGGIVMCETAVELQIKLAQDMGATICTNTDVVSVAPRACGGVEIRTACGAVHTADKAVVAAGSWMSDFFDPSDYSAAGLGVTRQVVYWFEVKDLAEWSDFPFLIWAGVWQTSFLSHFSDGNDHFAKTGSGQT
jgi:sarcosine oxidase